MLAPIVVGAVAVLLVARALVGSWLWGALAAAGLLLASAVGMAVFAAWGRKHPDQAAAFVAAWGRAMALGSGGWERRRESRTKSR